MVNHWINCSSLSDDSLSERIQKDGIDILIDLSGYTFGNRLLVFARKPAPIQISWMGYVGSTGLKAIDYRFTDVFAEPETTVSQCTEKPWLLKPVWYVYRPCIKNPKIRDSVEMQVRPTPALENGYVTFGCFNNISKITSKAIGLWSNILKSIPQSNLILVSKIENQLRSKVLAEFSLHGVEANRIIFLDFSKDNHYLFYHQIDIALDPFPYNGGTSTCDAVWMGVPFITLSGEIFRSRMGVTIANNIGHPEWIAKDETAYLQKACSLASDIPKLNVIRQSLRGDMEQSALMDEHSFTVNLEASFRKMWVEYCNSSQNEFIEEALLTQ